MVIRIWGTRGSIATPGPETVRYGGNTTCVEVRLSGGKTLILDAGSGIRPLGNSLLSKEKSPEVYLFITHIHWDHIMGFPFFAPIYREGTRIWLDGCKRAMEGLKLTLNRGMVDGVFPVSYEGLRSKIEELGQLGTGTLSIGDAVIDAIELNHPQGGMGFRIREGGKSLVFLTDNELAASRSNGRAFGDYGRFCEGVDLLIHDSQYLPEEMDAKRGWGHSDVISAVELALKAGVGRFLFTHHDPERTDLQVDRMMALAREFASAEGGHLQVEGAREGMIIEL